MRHQVELLAPAGSFESLRAAVNAGADAVYMGGTRFGARAYAENPDEKGLCDAIRFAHLHGCDFYMTVNTLLKESEMEELGAYLRPYYETGLDAVIVQDLGVFSYLKERFPDLPIHASTQMTVLGAEGAAFLKELGASRVVTARELSLKEIKRIHDQVDIEIESFIHGALCYCYSGQCLFSSMLGGRSGNRGRCAQPCRLPYQWKGKGKILNSPSESYLLSPKDMCTIELLPDILEAGVCSLKIEGRMKRPEYTAGVVSVYRKYLDRYLEKGRGGWKVSREDYEELQALYNRGGFSRGYYQVHNGKELMSLSRPGHFDGKGKKELEKKREYEQLLLRLKREFLEKDRKENIQGIFRISEKIPSEFVVEYKGCKVCVKGEPGQKPQKRATTAEEIKKQLNKTGDTPFVFERLAVEMDEEIFCPITQLNQMRREALSNLEAAVFQTAVRKDSFLDAASDQMKVPNHVSGDAAEQKASFSLRVQLENTELLPEVLLYPEVKSVYLTSEKADFSKFSSCVQACHSAGKECMLVLPAIFRTEAREFFKKNESFWKEAGFDGFVVKNLEEAGFLKKENVRGVLIADHNLYSWNKSAHTFWKEQGFLRDTLPLELNEKELKMRGSQESELLIYGYLPLMTTAGCVHKTIEGCDRKQEMRFLVDRYKKEFPTVNYCRYCYNILYNCEPLSLLNSVEEVRRIHPESLRLSFTFESRERVRQVLSDAVFAFCRGKKAERQAGGYTKGHLKRGVE